MEKGRVQRAMINKSILDDLDRLGFGADVDAFESYIESLQEAASLGKAMVTDTMYDYYIRILKELKPDSQLLHRNWEMEEYELDDHDELLNKYGMVSINTIQNMEDLNKFKAAIRDRSLTMTGTVKLNGHAIRAVYSYGKLVSGSTRGRYKKGRDITRHLKIVLPNYVKQWSDIRLLEVRGEMLVSLETFNSIRHILKTPLSSVTSLIRDSASEDEIKMLSCVCYKVITDDDWGVINQWDELSALEECGFEIPERLRVSDINYFNLDSKIEDFLNHFESLYDNGKLIYDTDGIVVAVDDKDIFYELGKDGNSYLGNFALKMGRVWESNIYNSSIVRVEFVHGKTYITPKAIIEPVITVTGSTVDTVPLYNIGVMEKLGLTPGNEIYFKFGGETGVTLVQPDGSPVSSLG